MKFGGFDFDNCSIDSILTYAKRNYLALLNAGKIKKKEEQEVSEKTETKVRKLGTIEVDPIQIDVN